MVPQGIRYRPSSASDRITVGFSLAFVVTLILTSPLFVHADTIRFSRTSFRASKKMFDASRVRCSLMNIFLTCELVLPPSSVENSFFLECRTSSRTLRLLKRTMIGLTWSFFPAFSRWATVMSRVPMDTESMSLQRRRMEASTAACISIAASAL